MIIQEGDEILHRCAAAGQSTCYIMERSDGRVFDLRDKLTKTRIRSYAKHNNLEEGTDFRLYKYSSVQPLSFAIHALESRINALKDLDEDIMIALSGGNNFRDNSAIRQPYKGNRFSCAEQFEYNGQVFSCGYPVSTSFEEDRSISFKCKIHGECAGVKEKPVHKEALLSHLKKICNCVHMEGYEADDGLGLYRASDPTMSHIDKDIMMVPGTHLDWRTMTFYKITQEKGMLLFFNQLLTGDRTDNIPGCPYNAKTAYGPQRAEKLLGDTKALGDAFSLVVGAYRDAFSDDWQKYICEAADLIWICRSERNEIQKTGADIMRYLIDKFGVKDD